MKNTFKIVKTHTTCGDKFYTVAITNQEGGTHTDTFSEVMMRAAIQKGVKFEIDTENDEVVSAVEELAYITVCEEEDGETEKSVYDVYFHKITADDFLEVDFAGDFLKTYKTEKAAMNFASKKGYPVL
jgi:hypothetical protein